MSTYEKIGSRLYQKWRYMKDADPEKDMLLRFTKHYSEVPLFIVGFKDEDLADVDLSDESLESFHLPFESLLLEFPKASYQPVFRKAVQPIIYISEISRNEYYVELLVTPDDLRTDELMRKAAESLSIDRQAADKALDRACVSSLLSFVFEYPGLADIDIQINIHHNYECKQQRKAVFKELIKTEEFEVCDGCNSPDGFCRGAANMARYVMLLMIKTLAYINQPQMYIIRETPELTDREKRLKQKAKIPFFSKKPKHIVLDYSQTKTLMSGSAGERRTKMPHERRGHWRQLRAGRYKKKGKVWVRPADINKGMNWKTEKKVYEVVK